MTGPAWRFAAAALVAAIALAPAGTTSQETGPIGVIVAGAGIATLMRQAIPAMPAPGDKVFAGDRIVTGPGARLRIALPDAATVSIGPRSDLALTHFTITDGGSVAEGEIDLARGIVRCELPPSDDRSRFEIRTPGAVVSALSANLIVEAEQAGVSAFVLSGRALVAGSGTGDPVALEQDFGVDVSADGNPGAPARWQKQRVARVVDLTAMR